MTRKPKPTVENVWNCKSPTALLQFLFGSLAGMPDITHMIQYDTV
jgi:hypothetical protein